MIRRLTLTHKYALEGPRKEWVLSQTRYATGVVNVTVVIYVHVINLFLLIVCYLLISYCTYLLTM
jgi:hypothetical protein